MATSRRKEIINYIVDTLKVIQGQSTGFISIITELDESLLTEDGSFITTEDNVGYVFHKNLYNNVFKGLKYLDQIQDFPAIYIQAAAEVFNYESKGNTTASLELMLRVYTYNEGSSADIEDIVEDVVRQIERISYSQNNRLIECLVVSVETDEGLLDPYGLGEIRLSLLYDVED